MSVSRLDGRAPDGKDFANYFCTYAYLYHQVGPVKLALYWFNVACRVLLDHILLSPWHALSALVCVAKCMDHVHGI
jgi:hypothetical protein